MSPSPEPWPEATPYADAGLPHPASPAPSQASHRKRRRTERFGSGRTAAQPRQQNTPAILDQARNQCQVLSGNDRFSCLPTADNVYKQGDWVNFVWNSRRPELVQQNKVNVYLFHGDSMQQIVNKTNLPNDPNQAGVVPFQVDDSWWGNNGPKFNGSSTTYPFYFVITPASRTIDGSQIPQTTFNAVQTTFPNSVLSSMSASSASASRVSASSAASASGRSSASPSTGPASGTSGVQGGSANSFPKWAIAVIVILGFLALAALCTLFFIILRRARRREQYNSNRNSMGSASPMMAHADNAGAHAGSPLLAAGAASAATDHRDDPDNEKGRAQSEVGHDGASTISRANSANDGPFSGADAAIMADAFRKALRKPDFADRPVEEGESPEHHEGKEELINRELAEEGRDIRSVSSSRGVKVETLSSDADTTHER